MDSDHDEWDKIWKTSPSPSGSLVMNRAQVVWNSPKTGSFSFHKGILRFQSTNLQNTHATLQFISLLIANHPNRGKQKVSIVMKIENTDTLFLVK